MRHTRIFGLTGLLLIGLAGVAYSDGYLFGCSIYHQATSCPAGCVAEPGGVCLAGGHNRDFNAARYGTPGNIGDCIENEGYFCQTKAVIVCTKDYYSSMINPPVCGPNSSVGCAQTMHTEQGCP